MWSGPVESPQVPIIFERRSTAAMSGRFDGRLVGRSESGAKLVDGQTLDMSEIVDLLGEREFAAALLP